MTDEKQMTAAESELGEIEHHDAPEPKRQPTFGLSKAGVIIIAILVVGLLAWHIGYTPDTFGIGRDAGGFAGGSDYGGGWGGGSSWDYDWGGGSSWDYDYDYDDDWDWGWTDSDTGYTYYGDYEEVGLIDFIFVLVVMAIIFLPGFLPFGIFGWGGKRQSTPRQSQPAGASRTDASQLQGIGKLQQRDPGFSPAEVEATIANVYVQMQQAWTAGDFEPMRPYFNNTLFSQFSNQLDALNKRGHTNYVDNIAVLETRVRGWYETNGFEYLVMKVRTRITDYTMDRNGRVVSGDMNAELFMEYEYTLGRPAGTQTTKQTAQTVAGECPNCGAPLNIAQSAKCPYCGTVVESNRFTWVITNIKGVSQQTQRR